jgi:hypothetical protein
MGMTDAMLLSEAVCDILSEGGQFVPGLFVVDNQAHLLKLLDAPLVLGVQ